MSRPQGSTPPANEPRTSDEQVRARDRRRAARPGGSGGGGGVATGRATAVLEEEPEARVVARAAAHHRGRLGVAPGPASSACVVVGSRVWTPGVWRLAEVTTRQPDSSEACNR